jgi:hypothetical protein
MPYNIVMENTTITQFVNDNVEGDPAFKGYIVYEMKCLVKQNPTMSLSDLLQDATESALEQWDRDQEAGYFQGE